MHNVVSGYVKVEAGLIWGGNQDVQVIGLSLSGWNLKLYIASAGSVVFFCK